jgi:LuxR family maltose regulon positive regulatory protein
VSGHSVSAAHEKIIGPLAGCGPASPNGHRQRAPEVIAENASVSIGSPRLPGRTSPPDPAENNWDAETPAPTHGASTPTNGASAPSFPALPLGSTDLRSPDMIGSTGRSDNAVGEAAARAVLLATKLHAPAIGTQLVHRAALLDTLSAGRCRKLTLLSAPARTSDSAGCRLIPPTTTRCGFGCTWSPRWRR